MTTIKLRYIMYKYAQGSNKAQNRQYLRRKFNEYIGEDWCDRDFRRLVADEPRIISCTLGYFIVPKQPTEYDLIKAKECIIETKSKATSILERCSKQLKSLESIQYQKELL